LNVINIHNVYNTTIINNNTTTVNRVSYNGGDGGINRRPRPEEEAASRERHIPPVAVQAQHAQAARANPELRASVNHGKPPVAATPRPGAFSDRAVVPAKQTGATYNHPMNRAPVQPPATMPAKHPENNAARSDRPTPNNRPESSRPPSAQPNNRNESQRPQSPSPNERSQPPPHPSCGNAVCTAATATAAVRASEAGREEASGRTTETEREVAIVTAGFRRRFNVSFR